MNLNVNLLRSNCCCSVLVLRVQYSDDSPAIKPLEDKELCATEERITDKSFKLWSTKFNEEMISKGLWGRKLPNKSRPSGRQLFESDKRKFEDGKRQ